MTYPILKFLHLLGLVLMSAGLIGVWHVDLRSRQLRELRVVAEAVRNIAVLYDGLVVPGALLLLGSGCISCACAGSRERRSSSGT